MKQVFLSLLLLFPAMMVSRAQEPKLIPTADHPVYFDVSPPLRDMLKGPIPKADRSWKDGVVKNYTDTTLTEGSLRRIADACLQQHFGPLTTDTTIQNFDGMTNIGGYVPPDTHGDVGFNHYFQVVNCSYAIFNKSGDKIFGPYGNSTVWSGIPNNSNDGDAIVLFDEQANRWLFSQFSLPNGSSTAPFFQMIAVSQSPDPTGSWYRYVYEFSAMPDYPKFGVWPDAYYMSTNNFGTGSAGWVGNGAYSYDRAAMLAGDPTATRISFTVSPGGDGFTSLLPADCDGAFPPAGTPNYFTYIRTGGTQRLGVYEFHSDFTTPANSTFGNITYLNVTPFNGLGWGDGIPQLGSPQLLETLGDRLMTRLQYRKFNGYASMVLNHSVSASAGVAGIRWYELRNSGAGWSIYQQSTYAPDAHSRWMGSIAMDTAGTISLGYSVSSSSIYPGIRYTGRMKNDPLNQMTINEKTIVDGGGSQTGNWSGRSRWGDYSAMSIDPAAPTTFWYTTEYYGSTSTSGWKTRIASFTYANVFSSAASATPAIICNTYSDSCQLNAYGWGGSGNYTYSWTSIPAGFNSTLKSPKVKVASTTRYVVATSDGTATRHDTTELRVVDAPTASLGNDTIVCWYVSPIQLHATATSYLRFLWGSTGDGTFTDPNSLETAYIPGIKDKTSGGTDIKLIVWPLTPCMNKASDLMHITLDPCTGTGELEKGGITLTAGPNPARDRVTLAATGLKSDASLTVSRLDDRMVWNGTLTSQASARAEVTIDVSTWASGMYLVRMESGSEIRMARFVVQ
ncbi:MAG TPA: T9SS type A sorting domain-containing protein [Bacteroidales bacterium]|nr:T9SS type A sorting domain-containing protein [Bacteroidales bacterium]